MCIIIMGATMGKSGGNLLDSLPTTQGTLHVVMLGLDSAGKTTALYRLKFDQYLNTVPTIGFNCEKVRGAVGKAKGVQFLVWDVGGQEKLRPLWRSYTRCTDGIVFVVDSVDVERMEEAKMELMRTAKCPDNQGVPVLILANKQDLPGAREPKELEKLLGLHELSPLNPPIPTSISLTSTSSSSSKLLQQQQQQQQHQQKEYDNSAQNQDTQDHEQCSTISGTGTIGLTTIPGPILSSSASSSSSSNTSNQQQQPQQSQQQQQQSLAQSSSSSITGTSTSSGTGSGGVGSGVGTSSSICQTVTPISSHQYQQQQSFKGWYIQPACAITGEGLQEGLEALYDMIMKKRKLNKTNKKKRNKKKW